MKKIYVNGGGYATYSSPTVATIEVAVEKGFALSFTDGELFPDPEDGGWGTLGE